MKVRVKVPLYKHQRDYVLSKHPRPCICAGYGSGKTYSNVHRTLYLLKLRKGKAFIFYAAPTYDLIYSTYYIELIETLDKFRIRYHEDKQHHSILIDTPELKGTIKLVSLEKYKNLIGFTATDGILDEFDTIALERQKAIWTRALARLRGAENGTLAITTTPEGHKYVYQLHKSGKIMQITAATTDNKSLPQSFIDDMMECYDDAHIAMYVYGQYMNLAGLRAMYNYREEDLIKPIAQADIPNQLLIGMDFNVDPFCLTVSFINALGYLITFDEMRIRNAAGADGYDSFTDKTMMLLLQRYPNQWYKAHIDESVTKVYDITIAPDATGSQRETQAKYTDIGILKRYGVKILADKTNPPAGSRMKLANIAMQKGLWQITENCKHLCQDMEMCVTDELGELKKDDKELTHMLDAATYPVFQTFKDILFKRKSSKEL